MLAPRSQSKPQVHYLDEVWMRKPIRQHVKEFACVISIVMLLIAGFLTWKGYSFATGLAVTFTALILVFLGYKVPSVLHPVWKSWMTLAVVLGAIVTTIILSIGWAILVIPFALVMRAVGKHVMNTAFRTAAPSYWEIRDTKLDDFKLLERQY